MRLYEKYRPTTLDAIVGQDKAVKVVTSLLARHALGGQSIWVSGTSGIGKTTLARVIAREFGAGVCGVTEYDSADQFGQPEIDALSREFGFHSMFGNRVVIVNEAHGLRKAIIRQLLGIMERIPSDTILIFTTTRDGEADLFEDQIDSGPLLSRCLKIRLTNQGLANAFAVRASEIATAEGLNGRPIEAYVRLAKDAKNNMREMLQIIEAGGMLA